MIDFTRRVIMLLAALAITTTGAFAQHLIRSGQALSYEKESKSGQEQIGMPKRLSGMDLQNTPQMTRVYSKAVANDDNEDIIVLVDEDFHLFAAGTQDVPDTKHLNDTGYDLSPEYISDGSEGWWGMGIFQAGGACALNYPGYGGFISTPFMDMSGDVTITLRGKLLPHQSGEQKRITIGIAKGNVAAPTPVATTKQWFTHEWQEFTFTYTNESTEQMWVQIDSYDYVIIDDLKITVESNFLATPQTLPATDFTIDGFTANWSPVRKAEEYLLTVFRDVPMGDENVTITENFDNINTNENFIDTDNPNYPEGWDISVDKNGAEMHVSKEEGLYMSAPQAIAFDAAGDYIASPNNGGIVTELYFWAKNVKEKPGLETSSKITFYGWTGFEWKHMGVYVYLSMVPNNGTTYDLNLDLKNKEYYAIKIQADIRNDEGILAIDDIKVITTPPAEREYVLDHEPIDGLSHTLAGLNEEADYYYYVKADNPEMTTSEMSNVQKALGISAPVVKEASNITVSGYTANWLPTPKADRYELTHYAISAVSEDITGYIVLSEDFSKVDAPDSPEDPIEVETGSLLDEFTDYPGWYGHNYFLLSEGMIGALGDPDWGIKSYLLSPELMLHNDNGNYTIEISAWGYEGDELIMTATNDAANLAFTSTGLTRATFNLTGGKESDIIKFTSKEGLSFFIDEIAITQNLKAGDKITTMAGSFPITGKENTSYTFTNLANEEGLSYAYDLVAYYDKETFAKFVSNRSERIFTSLKEARKIVAQTPEAAATEVELVAEVSVTFDENITGVELDKIVITPNPGNVSADINGKVLIIAHDTFEEDTRYTVTIPAGVVEDYPKEIEWSFTTKTIVGIEGMNETEITLFPNPASDMVYLNNLPTDSKVIIYDITGKAVSSLNASGSLQIPLDIEAGIYLVRIESAGQVITKKLIVNSTTMDWKSIGWGKEEID